jgi:glycerol uptake facilitator-like aquaporin
MDGVAELVGTFIFVSIILITGNPIAIAVGLLAVIYFTSSLSKGSLNPAVSISLFCRGDLNLSKLFIYILAEVLGVYWLLHGLNILLSWQAENYSCTVPIRKWE